VRLETRAVHGGQDPHPTSAAAVAPIHQTSTFAQEEVGGRRGYEYSGHPTPTHAGGQGDEPVRLRRIARRVESPIELPAAMTEASIAGSPFPVSDTFIRLSVGSEGVEGLVENLAAALG